MKFSGKVGNGPMNKWLNFADDPDHRLDKGIVLRIRDYLEIRKMVNGHSFVLSRQMTALARRALAEVYEPLRCLSVDTAANVLICQSTD